MKIFDMYGNLYLEAESLKLEGDQLVMRGKAMGSMTMAVYLRPEEIWSGKKLLSWSVIFHLPIILIKGWWQSRKPKV